MPRIVIAAIVIIAVPDLVAQYTDGASGPAADGGGFDWNWLGLLGLLGLLPRKPVDEYTDGTRA